MKSIRPELRLFGLHSWQGFGSGYRGIQQCSQFVTWGWFKPSARFGSSIWLTVLWVKRRMAMLVYDVSLMVFGILWCSGFVSEHKIFDLGMLQSFCGSSLGLTSSAYRKLMNMRNSIKDIWREMVLSVYIKRSGQKRDGCGFFYERNNA